MKVKELRDLLSNCYPDDDIEIFVDECGKYHVKDGYLIQKSTNAENPVGVYLVCGDEVEDR